MDHESKKQEVKQAPLKVKEKDIKDNYYAEGWQLISEQTNEVQGWQLITMAKKIGRSLGVLTIFRQRNAPEPGLPGYDTWSVSTSQQAYEGGKIVDIAGNLIIQ